MLCVALCGILLSFAPVQATALRQAQGDGYVTLKYRPLKTDQEIEQYSNATNCWRWIEPASTFAAYKPPADAVAPFHFSHWPVPNWPNEHTRMVVGLVAKTKAGPTILWLDLNDNKRFERDERFVGHEYDGTFLFGPVHLGPGPGAHRIVYCGAYLKDPDNIGYGAAGVYEGTVKLDGRAVKVLATDNNVDGRLDWDVSWDWLFVDWNGDGKPQRHDFAGVIVGPKGRFYALNAADNPLRVWLRPDPTLTGMVGVRAKKFELKVSGSRGPIEVASDGDPVKLPAGRYLVETLVMQLTAESRTIYLTFWGNESPGTPYKLEVVAGKTTALAVGPPMAFTASPTVAEDGAYRIPVGMLDKSGLLCMSVTQSDRTSQDPVGIITDADGKELSREKVNCFGSGSFIEWTPPKDAKRPFKLRIEFKCPGLEVKPFEMTLP